MSQNVVYISNEKISVVRATVKRDAIRVESCFQIPLREGTMLNGIIIDDRALKDGLKQVAEHNIHEVDLIVDSAKILAKTASIPKMKEKQVLQFVKDEFATAENNQQGDYVYDYAYLKADETAKGASKILCVGVEREFITNYIEAFKEVGITLNSIDYAINSCINLTQELPGLLNKTYAITQVDGQNLVSVVFMNNEYSLTNRSRVFSNRGTSEYENEILGVVSQLKQFTSSSQYQQSLSELYFFGLETEEENDLFKRIKELFNIDASRLPKAKAINVVGETTFDLNDYVYCLGHLKRK